MNTSTVYEVEQLTLNLDALDKPQLSLCPKCSSDIIRLADGCHKYLSKINCALLGRGSFGSRGGRGRGEKDLL